MIYNINDKLPIGKLVMFSIQMVLSVFVATVLIANICGVAVSGALVGAGLSTLVYLILTRFKSPMFVSSSGAFVAPVLVAMAAGGYTAIAIGGLVTCLIYSIFGLIFTKVPVEKIYRIFPPALIGAVTVVIGVNLMPFILSYVQINGITNIIRDRINELSDEEYEVWLKYTLSIAERPDLQGYSCHMLYICRKN